MVQCFALLLSLMVFHAAPAYAEDAPAEEPTEEQASTDKPKGGFVDLKYVPEPDEDPDMGREPTADAGGEGGATEPGAPDPE